MRSKLIAAVGASLALAPAAPASAGTLSTQNTCLFSIDQTWRHLNVDLSGTAAPSPVAPGSGLGLTRTSGRMVVPAYLLQYAANAGILQEGENQIPVKVWAALSAPETAQGTQVVTVESTARVTVTNGESGPLDVTVNFPDSAWTAGTGAIGFRQGPAGTIPAQPVGPGDANVRPRGSVFINARVGALLLNIDCQPGSGEGMGITPTVATAGAFETVAIDASVPPTPVPTVKTPALSLKTARLKRSGKRFSVALACADAACKGTVSAKYAGGTAAKAVEYSLAAGASKTYKLTLSSKALKALKKKSLLLSVKVTAEGGMAVSKKLRLK
jgi:hypothetical protein